MSAFKHLVFSILTLAAIAALPDPIFAAGDEASGLALAQAWCTGCHVVGPTVAGGDSGPPFAAVANRSNLSPGALRAWLTEPHPPMPNLDLSRQQIDDITAYLDSLRHR
jgi:mono/diheme cytochrome c family protein